MSTDPPDKETRDKQELPEKGPEPETAAITSTGSTNSGSAPWPPRPAASGSLAPRASWDWAWPWVAAGSETAPSSMEAGGVYLRGVAVPNSPARGLSEWQRSLRQGDVDPFPPRPALLQIFENSEYWTEDDDVLKQKKSARKPNRRTLLSLPDILDDEQASGYLSEDEGPDADKESKKTNISEPESPEERESTLYSETFLREINCIAEETKESRLTNTPVMSPSEWNPSVTCPMATPDETVAARTPALALPLAAMRQRRRSSQMAAQRLQAIRHEIDTKLAEIDAKISGENLPPERLTYSYVMHKCKSIAGDVESSDEEHRNAGPVAPPVNRCPLAEGVKMSVWAGGAARPSGASCVSRRPLTAPQALMRRRLAGRVATVLEEEQPASMPATGDEASTTSASPEPRSPTASRRRRVRKASAGRRRSQEPPGSSSSSSMSSSPSSHSHSAGRGGRWRSTLSPMRILPSSVRKRPSVAGVLGGATTSKHINPFHSFSFPKSKRGG